MLTGTAPGDTGTAAVSMSESRNHRTKRTSSRGVMWFAGSGLPRETVTAVHVHEEGTGRLVLDVPLTPVGPPSVITQVFEQQPYAGAVPWDDAYRMLGEGRAYVDVHTAGQSQPRLRGTLQPQSSGWHDFFHAYCS